MGSVFSCSQSDSPPPSRQNNDISYSPLKIEEREQKQRKQGVQTGHHQVGENSNDPPSTEKSLEKIISNGIAVDLERFLSESTIKNVSEITLTINGVPWTPLQYAINQNRGDLVLIFIQRGVNVNEIYEGDSINKTALKYALDMGHVACSKILSAHGGINYYRNGNTNTHVIFKPSAMDNHILDSFKASINGGQDVDFTVAS